MKAMSGDMKRDYTDDDKFCAVILERVLGAAAPSLEGG